MRQVPPGPVSGNELRGPSPAARKAGELAVQVAAVVLSSGLAGEHLEAETAVGGAKQHGGAHVADVQDDGSR